MTKYGLHGRGTPIPDMKKAILTILFLALVFPLSGQEKAEPAPDPAGEKIQTWKIPDLMLENLNYMVEEFNRAFNAKLERYKAELKARYPEFKDLPVDVIFDPASGVFIRPDDYKKIIEKQQAEKKMVVKDAMPVIDK